MCAGSHNSKKNPSQICAYLKSKAGWGTTTLITESKTYTAAKNQFFVFYKNIHKKTEYFIIEARFNEGRDEHLPTTGLAIWHVDEVGDQNNEQMTPKKHYECSLEQADGHNDLEKQRNNGDASDLFRPGQMFSSTSSPNSRWWNGKESGLEITEIVIDGNAIHFKANILPKKGKI
jgi:hypothetical protein